MKRAAVLFQASVSAVVLAASLAGATPASAQYTPYQPYQPYHYQTYSPPAYQPYQAPSYQPYQPYHYQSSGQSQSQSSQTYRPYHYQPYQPYHSGSSQPSQTYQPYHYEPYHSNSSNEDESDGTSEHSNSSTWTPYHSHYQAPTTPLVPPYHSFTMDPPYAPNSGSQYHYEHSTTPGHDEIVGPNGPVWHEGLNPTVPDPYQGKKPSFTDKTPGFPVDPKEKAKEHEEHNEAPPWL